MAYLFLIAGWLVAILCMVLLAVDIFRARRLKKAEKAVTRERRLWSWRRWSVEDVPPSNTIATTSASTDATADADFSIRPWIRPAGVIAFLLWEAFWISEIFEQPSNGRALQLPYVFLLVMMVGVPAVVYFLSRKWLAPDPEEA